MADKPKVIIAVPCSDTFAMRAMTAQAIGGAIIGAEGLVTDMILRRSCDIVSNRTWLVNESIKKGATHILFVDCDMVFPSDAIPTLLAHDKEIVGVEYNKRTFPLEGVFKPMTEKKDELYEAEYTGMGLMLIKLSVFEKLGIYPDGKRLPWFCFGRDSQGALALGEDAWFSKVARDFGYKTYIDPKIKIGHIGEYCF